MVMWLGLRSLSDGVRVEVGYATSDGAAAALGAHIYRVRTPDGPTREFSSTIELLDYLCASYDLDEIQHGKPQVRLAPTIDGATRMTSSSAAAGLPGAESAFPRRPSEPEGHRPAAWGAGAQRPRLQPAQRDRHHEPD